MEYITLNNGNKIPLVGTGTNTYGKENNDYMGEILNDIPELRNALDLGYRLIDAAITYRNEELVGKVLADTDVPRDELFITTKIPNEDEYVSSKDAVRQTIDNSLKNFHTDYIDLYLIHFPIENKDYLRQTWEVLEEYYNEGKLKSIGVSNFDEVLIDEMKEYASVKPAVNQIQINLKEANTELIEKLKAEDITPMAWGPMKATEEQQKVLEAIGQNHNKTWGQVLLKYQIQRGIVVIPKSHSDENQKANLDIFDSQLTDDEDQKIAELA